MSGTSNANLGAKLILSGMICLFMAILFFTLGLIVSRVTGFFGDTLLTTIAKGFAFLWIPLIVVGAVFRVTGDASRTGEAGAPESSTSESSEIARNDPETR